PIGQVQDLQEKFFFDLGPSGNSRRPTSPSQNRHHGDNDDADQRMFPIDGRTRVLQFVKVANDLVQGDVLSLRHRSSSVSCCKGATRRTVYEEISKGASGPDYPEC